MVGAAVGTNVGVPVGLEVGAGVGPSTVPVYLTTVYVYHQKTLNDHFTLRVRKLLDRQSSKQQYLSSTH